MDFTSIANIINETYFKHLTTSPTASASSVTFPVNTVDTAIIVFPFIIERIFLDRSRLPKQNEFRFSKFYV